MIKGFLSKFERLPALAKLYILFSSLVSFVDGISGAYLFITVYNNIGAYGLGLTLLINKLCVTFTDYPTGVIADALGRKRSYSLGLALEGASLVILSISREILWAIVASIVSGIGVSLMSGSLQAWVVDGIREYSKNLKEDLASTFSLARGFSTIAKVFAGFIAAFIAIESYWLPVFASGLLMIVLSLIVTLVGEENYGEIRKISPKVMIEIFKNYALKKEILLSLVSSVNLSAAFWVLVMSWQPLLKDLFKIQESTYGLVWSLMMVSASLGAFVVAFLSRYGMGNVLLFSLGVTSISYIILSALGTLQVKIAIASILAIEFLDGIHGSLMRTLYNIIIPSNVRASLLSLMSAANSVVQAIMSIILGVLISLKGYSFIYLIAAITTILVIPIIKTLLTEIDQFNIEF